MQTPSHVPVRAPLAVLLTSLGALVALLAAPPIPTVQDATTLPSASVVHLAIEGHVNAAPSIAARGALVAVGWGAQREGRWNIYAATSRDGGRSFSLPVRVNHVDGDGRVNGEIAPRIALVNRRGQADPDVMVAWNAKDATTEIRIASSRDLGKSYAEGEALQSAGAAGDRGWHALAIDRDGSAHAIWLDHRGLAEARRQATASGAKTSPPGMDGLAMAQHSTLRYAARGRTRVEDRVVASGVCYCCKTALVSTSKGMLAAWRHVYEGNMRDIAFAWLDRPVADAPARVSRDGWSINGCPDDGPALAVDADERVHAVWPTVEQGATPRGGIFYAVLEGASGFTPRLRVPTLGSPKPSHPQVAVEVSGRLHVAWDEVREGVRRAAIVSAASAAGQVPTFGAPRFVTSATVPSQYPVMAAVRGALLIATMDGPSGQTVIGVRRVDSQAASR
jgi:hypothetical protein